MSGLLKKIFREIWLQTLLIGLAFAVILGILSYVLPDVEKKFPTFIKILSPSTMKFMSGLLGVDDLAPQAIRAFLWVHPVVLALLWAHEIILSTRFPAGEIDGLPSDSELPLGDIVIFAAVVKDEAADQGKSLLDHWAHMTVHGTLHLLGFNHLQEDDAAAMESLEIQILGDHGIANPYGESPQET